MYQLVRTSEIDEPVTLEEAHQHLRLDHEYDDTLISMLITAAREYAENVLCWRSLTERRYECTFDSWPASGQLWLPMPPVTAIEQLLSVADDGSTTEISESLYALDGELGRVRFLGANPRAARCKVVYLAGYGQCPASFKAGLLLLIGHWYENREEVVVGAGLATAQLPVAAQHIFLGSRAWRPEPI